MSAPARSVPVAASWLPFVVAALLGIALNVTLTLPIGDADGLRLGASDPLVVLALLLPLAAWWRTRRLPAIDCAGGWWWLLAIAAWMGVALLVGRTTTGVISAWGLVNKTIGFGVLVAYLAMGLWLAANRQTERLLRWLLASAWLISAGAMVVHVLFMYRVLPRTALPGSRVQGLLDNPNAFGIAIAAILLLQLPFAVERRLFPRWLHVVGMSVSGVALLNTFSRSAWIGALLALVVLVVLRPAVLRTALSVMAVVVCLQLLLFEAPDRARAWFDGAAVAGDGQASSGVSRQRNLLRKSNTMELRLQGSDQEVGVSSRVQAFWLSMRYAAERPFLGHGLGGWVWRSGRDGVNEHRYQLHNTALWLLVETGAVGLLLVIGWFAACAVALFRRRADALAFGVLGVLLVLAGASVATEVLYQRYAWLLLGLALAAPCARATGLDTAGRRQTADASPVSGGD